jgi:hypothetical protein
MRSSRRITPGQDVVVRMSTLDFTLTVRGQVTRSYLVPLANGRVGYDATVLLPEPTTFSVVGHDADTAPSMADECVLTGTAPQSSAELLAIFDVPRR